MGRDAARISLCATSWGWNHGVEALLPVYGTNTSHETTIAAKDSCRRRQEGGYTPGGGVMEASDRVWRERSLREAVLAGDEQAWRQWYDECCDGLYAYLLWRCGGLRDHADE